MSEEREHRTLDMDVSVLIDHVKMRMYLLPRLASKYHLSEKAIGALRTHLQEELDYLDTLPPGIVLEDVINTHLERANQYLEMVPQRRRGGRYGENYSSKQ